MVYIICQVQKDPKACSEEILNKQVPHRGMNGIIGSFGVRFLQLNIVELISVALI